MKLNLTKIRIGKFHRGEKGWSPFWDSNPWPCN